LTASDWGFWISASHRAAAGVATSSASACDANESDKSDSWRCRVLWTMGGKLFACTVSITLHTSAGGRQGTARHILSTRCGISVS